MDAPADTDRKIWQPIHPSIRDKLDPQYVSFHDQHMQYVQSEETMDAAALQNRKGLPPSGSEPTPVGSIRDVDVGRFSVRVYTPEGECDERGWPVLIWFHGGGFIGGSLASGTDFCSLACRDARCMVVTVGYRLAPKNPFPSAVEDAVDSVTWVASSPSELGMVDTSRITIGGTSAGGNLAVIAALAVLNPEAPMPSVQGPRSRSIAHPPLSLLLVVPVVDNTAAIDGVWKPKADTAPWLTPGKMEFCRKLYFTRDEDRKRWDASPNLATDSMLQRLPRTWMAVAEHDLLAPEALAFREQIKGLGVEIETDIVQGATHMIMSFNGRIDRGKKLLDDAVMHLKKVFGS